MPTSVSTTYFVGPPTAWRGPDRAPNPTASWSSSSSSGPTHPDDANFAGYHPLSVVHHRQGRSPVIRRGAQLLEQASSARGTGPILDKLLQVKANPRPIHDLTSREFPNNTAELRWTAPSSSEGNRKIVQYVMQCRPEPGILGNSLSTCPIKVIRMPPPGNPDTVDRARVVFQPSQYTVGCTCAVQSVDESGCVSLPSNEAQIHNQGSQNEHTAVTLILFGCVLGAISLVALCSLLWIGRSRVQNVAARAAYRRRQQMERFFALAEQAEAVPRNRMHTTDSPASMFGGIGGGPPRIQPHQMRIRAAGSDQHVFSAPHDPGAAARQQHGVLCNECRAGCLGVASTRGTAGGGGGGVGRASDAKGKPCGALTAGPSGVGGRSTSVNPPVTNFSSAGFILGCSDDEKASRPPAAAAAASTASFIPAGISTSTLNDVVIRN